MNPAITLDAPEPGDFGWVISQHGALYHQEYGYDRRFEALVARITADFAEQSDPQREGCWIARRGEQRLGSIFVVQKSKRVAKLRLFLIAPEARGLGLGRRMLSTAIDFARQAHYTSMVLWTQQDLLAARHLYRSNGFEPVSESAHQSFGKSLVSEVWSRKL